MSHKGIHNPFFEIKHKNYPPFSYQLIKNMSKKLPVTVIQKSPKYFTVGGPRDHPGRQNLEPHKNGPRAAPEQETGGNPGPGPPMGGCNGNSRLVLGFQCSTETYPCTTVTRTCITYPHDPSRVPGWDVMASVWRPLGGEK